MARSSRSGSVLYVRLRLLQRGFPLLASLSILSYEVVEHAVLAEPIARKALMGEVLVYGFIGPIIIFLILTWLLHRVRERDEAEARLTALYEVSHQSASARGLEELEGLALTIPERAGLTHARASLIAQESPGGPWLLAGTVRLDSAESAALQSALASGEVEPLCAGSLHTASPPKSDCPLLRAIAPYSPNSPQSALCLPLSREGSRRVVLSVYLPDTASLPPPVTETLESMGSALAVALDRESLRARQRQLLQQVQQAVRSEQLGLVPTLEHILAGIATEHSIEAAAVFLLGRTEGGRLTPVACWPGPQAGARLADSALAAMPTAERPALLELHSVTPAAGVARSDGVVAVPITRESETLGVLVLAGEPDGACLPEQNILDIVSSMMALLVRNSQLYAQLEYQAVLDERNHLARDVHDGLAQSLGFLNFKVQQVQRLLARGQVAEATVALQELRDGGQEAYTEVRMMIQDLRWMMGDQDKLGQRLQQYGAAFGARTRLAVTVDAGAEPTLSRDAQRELFRVVQEALNNVSRHADARRVTVRLGEGPGGVTLTVEDDGIGLQPAAHENGEHLGLRIMRERVQSVGGELRIESRPNQGTTLHVRVPSGVVASERGRTHEVHPTVDR